MQTCSRCNASSPDLALECGNCHADLRELSVNAAALKKFQENPRVTTLRVIAAGDACALCHELSGTFDKMSAPKLPHEGCSHALGCRCAYEPALNDIYP